MIAATPSLYALVIKSLRAFNSIIVHDDLPKSDPELVRAFVVPTIKGFLYGRAHPDEAVATMRKYLETADAAIRLTPWSAPR
jgi:ABC-type nitrate/sulfonate/bicarbonate transport system substrate-binding protein